VRLTDGPATPQDGANGRRRQHDCAGGGTRTLKLSRAPAPKAGVFAEISPRPPGPFYEVANAGMSVPTSMLRTYVRR
jgi:hypothetical protein